MRPRKSPSKQQPPRVPTRALVLWADDTSANLGVRVLAAGTQEVLRSIWPDIAVEFHYSDASTTAPCSLGRKNIAQALARPNHPLRRWMRRFDIVVDTGGGDSFADIYGMPRLWSIVAVRALASRFASHVILGPQTVGPFESRTGALAAKASLIGVDTVYVRDRESERYCRQRLGRVPVHTTDVVFALPRPPESTHRHDIVLNVSGLLWNENSHVDSRRYREVCRELCAWADANGRDITLLVHVLDNATNDLDREACEELARQAAGRPRDVIVPRDLDHVRTEVAAARVVIGARMHACLNALSVGVPAIPWAYSRKFEPLLRDIGWRGALSIDDEDLVERTINWLADLEQDPPDVAGIAHHARERLDVFTNGVRAFAGDAGQPDVVPASAAYDPDGHRIRPSDA